MLHAPFAAADQPARTDAGYYAPLRDLRLPDAVRFAAGFAHEAQPLADQLAVRDRIEGLLQRQVVVSSACGLGRRSEADARTVLHRTAALCRD